MNERITEFGFQSFKFLNGVEIKIRPLTFKEKRDYLALIEVFQKQEITEATFAPKYIEMQVEAAFFVIHISNPEITKEEIENNINGDILKKIIDVAFYDPFSIFNNSVK